MTSRPFPTFRRMSHSSNSGRPATVALFRAQVAACPKDTVGRRMFMDIPDYLFRQGLALEWHGTPLSVVPAGIDDSTGIDFFCCEPGEYVLAALRKGPYVASFASSTAIRPTPQPVWLHYWQLRRSDWPTHDDPPHCMAAGGVHTLLRATGLAFTEAHAAAPPLKARCAKLSDGNQQCSPSCLRHRPIRPVNCFDAASMAAVVASPASTASYHRSNPQTEVPNLHRRRSIRPYSWRALIDLGKLVPRDVNSEDHGSWRMGFRAVGAHRVDQPPPLSAPSGVLCLADRPRGWSCLYSRLVVTLGVLQP